MVTVTFMKEMVSKFNGRRRARRCAYYMQDATCQYILLNHLRTHTNTYWSNCRFTNISLGPLGTCSHATSTDRRFAGPAVLEGRHLETPGPVGPPGDFRTPKGKPKSFPTCPSLCLTWISRHMHIATNAKNQKTDAVKTSTATTRTTTAAARTRTRTGNKEQGTRQVTKYRSPVSLHNKEQTNGQIK